MQLVYQIPDKLYYIQQFLDYSTYKKLHYDVFKSKLIKLHSTKESWDPRLFKNYKNYVDYTDLIETYKPFQKFKILLNTNPFIKINHNKMNFLLHSMRNNSGINWHNDWKYEYGITYYINRRWNSFGCLLSRFQNFMKVPVSGTL
jgi:CRISPR/Cas system-associated protein endoribonuclease Cas2